LDKKYEYYFDLLALLIEHFPTKNIQNNAGIKKYCLKKDITDSFCRSFPISKKKDEQSTRYHYRFISGEYIINNHFASEVNKFLANFDDLKEEYSDKYMDHLNAILGSIGGYSIPATIIPSDCDLGVVVRVFEKVKTRGQKLGLFSLINAKSFQVINDSYKGGLSDYLTNEIKKIIAKGIDLKKGVNKFLDYDENNSSFKKLSKVIHIFEIADLLNAQKTSSIMKSTMLKRESEFWFEK
jgi:hypothetical protein